jgi:hypothetical protein
MPKVNVFLRSSERLHRRLLIDSIETTPKKDFIIKLHDPCEDPIYNTIDHLIKAVHIHFDESEAERYINLFRKDAELSWIPCTEQLPEYGETVLGYSKSQGWEKGRISMINRSHTDRDGEHYRSGTNDAYFVTHWMPLPPSPDK